MAARKRAVAEPDPLWLDEMVKKLIHELERQLAAVGKSKPRTTAERAADARTLASLERTLERLSRLETQRAAVREKKVANHDGGARAALERRLDQRLAATRGAAGKPERD